jgi:hypothetical protein
MIGKSIMPGAAQFAQFIAQLETAKWNAVIPKCALHAKEDGSSIKYLHPTKGWRWVHQRRLKVLA